MIFSPQILVRRPPKLVTSSDAAATTAFLARTSGLDTTHTNAYKALINGLVLDGVFAKLDALYVFCTADAATALLNLCSSSFNATNNSATFTADQGFAGTSASTTVYIDSGFNPSTAGGHYTQNACHAGVWVNADVGGQVDIALGISGSGSLTDLYPKYTDGNTYARIQDGTGSGGVAVASAAGHLIAVRTASNSQKIYKNASDLGLTPSDTSGALLNKNIYILAENGPAGAANGYPGQLSVAHFGGALTATDVTNLNSRLGTFRTAVGL